MARSISSPAVGLGDTVGTGDMLGEVGEGEASAALGLGVTVGDWPSAPVASAIEQIQIIGSVFIVPLTVRCSHRSIWIQKLSISLSGGGSAAPRAIQKNGGFAM